MKQRIASWCLGVATVALGPIAHPVLAQETPPEASQEAQPQRLYVSDKLVLNVYSTPGQGERVATIETGDAVEAFERSEGSVRVKLDDGREGWVGASYLTAEAPAALRLRELQREQKSTPTVDKKAAEELARLRKDNAALASEVKALKESVAASNAAAANAASMDEEFDEPRTEGQAAPRPSPTPSRALWWAGLVALATGAAGFAAGYQTLARRIRRKFGGLKVY